MQLLDTCSHSEGKITLGALAGIDEIDNDGAHHLFGVPDRCLGAQLTPSLVRAACTEEAYASLVYVAPETAEILALCADSTSFCNVGITCCASCWE